MLKADRRQQKRTKAWYKKHLANNRKSLDIVIQARLNRLVGAK